MKNTKPKNEDIFIHSRCCFAHWELVIHKNEMILKCEKCGKPLGPNYRVIEIDKSFDRQAKLN